MSKFVKALGALILVFLVLAALRSRLDARAEALRNPPSPGFQVMPETRGIPGPTLVLAIKGVKAGGALSPATVRKILAANFAGLTECCRQAAKNSVPLPRKITLVFQVGPDGRLTGAPRGKPPLATQKFESLMASSFRTLQFPAFKGDPVLVEVTLALAG